MIEIAVDIRIIANGYITGIIAIFLRLSTTSPHEVIIADRNTAICTIQNIFITDTDNILLIVEISKFCFLITLNTIIANDNRISQSRSIFVVIPKENCILGIGDGIIGTDGIQMGSAIDGIIETIHHVILGNIILYSIYRIINTKNLCFLRIVGYVTTADDKGSTTTLTLLHGFHQSVLQSLR